ncbi:MULTISPECIES: fimbria/pilus periplasmic chaperone [unclassified Acinetobacter]|uniref:fimbria/pilus periplasmic chaperone n=1 Tax=unclassified Acinetobacter TaxID=196816 RepID=UPI0029350565|nr:MULTISPECIES: fimbria/pilus periplasmic chaperone [unclassified Acinetobacter]WOE33015.1 fimbria/pilus periplasmic chaperone [Acinetobacter sp. SAAs470]WOE38493.1 fimbria/pilus periplasmic chaperone [Acinetobacter sp. SAAs474]
MKKNYKNLIYIFLLIFIAIVSTVNAGGVALGATRIIYAMDARETALQITNSDTENKFLIQSWVESGDGKKSSDFVVTPPLFVIKPNSENTLRITYVGQDLPQDRETLYWLNSKSIPSIDYSKIQDINVLQIAILSRIKLFVRPANLAVSYDDAAQQLIFKKQDDHHVIVENNSPYFITLVNLKIREKELSSIMVPPKDQVLLAVPYMAEHISYQTINDYGARTPLATVIIQ